MAAVAALTYASMASGDRSPISMRWTFFANARAISPNGQSWGYTLNAHSVVVDGFTRQYLRTVVKATADDLLHPVPAGEVGVMLIQLPLYLLRLPGRVNIGLGVYP